MCFSLCILFLQHRSRSAHLFDARDFSVLKYNHPFRLIGDLRIVRNDDNGTAGIVQLFENLHNQKFVFFIEVAGRFVRKQELGVIDERAGNTHALLLSARKLIGQVLCEKLKKVYLMHISKDNNTPELAYNSLYQILERENKSHLEIEIINEEGTEIYKI